MSSFSDLQKSRLCQNEVVDLSLLSRAAFISSFKTAIMAPDFPGLGGEAARRGRRDGIALPFTFVYNCRSLARYSAA